MLNESQELPKLPQRPREAHKGDFGHVLVVAGSPGMTGAGCMAAAAAQRAGAGLVTLALPRSLNLVAEIVLGSAMSLPLPETPDGALGTEALQMILPIAERFDVVAIGPGLRAAQQTQKMVRQLVREVAAPLVVDADGLNALAGDPDALRGRGAPAILTPHPGEMARLAGLGGAAEVQADRVAVAARFAEETGTVLVLKGYGTVVTDGQQLYVNRTGNPGMATGGTGDVLTGLIAGLLCQGLSAFDAARLGTFVHGLAGDVGAESVGELSLTAEDVLQGLPEVLMAMAELGQMSGSHPLSARQARSFVMERARAGQ